MIITGFEAITIATGLNLSLNFMSHQEAYYCPSSEKTKYWSTETQFNITPNEAIDLANTYSENLIWVEIPQEFLHF